MVICIMVAAAFILIGVDKIVDVLIKNYTEIQKNYESCFNDSPINRFSDHFKLNKTFTKNWIGSVIIKNTIEYD